MKFAAVWLVIASSSIIAVPAAHAQYRPYRGKVFENPQYIYEVQAPPGFIICAGPVDAPASHGIEVPMGKRCNGKKRVEITAHFDAAESYADLRHRAVGECRGRSDPDPDPPFVIEDAGKLLSGLDTIICTRNDEAFDEYQKRVMARLEGATPIDYAITVYSSFKDRTKADALLSQVIERFKITR